LAGTLVRGASGPLTDGRVKVRIDGTASLAKLVGRPISMPVPLDPGGKAAVKGRPWRMDRLEISSGRSMASGSLVVRLEPRDRKVTAVVESPFMDLPELAGWKRDDRKDAKIRGRHLFSDAPSRSACCRASMAGSSSRLCAWRLPAGPAGIDRTWISISGTVALKIDPLRLTIGGGSLSGTADVDATPVGHPRYRRSSKGATSASRATGGRRVPSKHRRRARRSERHALRQRRLGA